MRLSIRYKLLLSFALVLVLSSLVYLISFQITKDYVNLQIGNLQLEKSLGASERIQNFFSNIETLHLGFGRNYLEHQGNLNQDLIEIIRYSVQENEYLKGITFLSVKGKELLKVDRFNYFTEHQLNYEIPTEAFDKSIQGETAYSKVYYSDPTSGPQMDIFSPIYTNEGGLLGIIKSEIFLTQLWNVVSQIKLGNLGYVYILDEEGRVIVHPNADMVLQGPNFSNRKVIAAVLNNTTEKLKQSDYIYRNEKGVEVIARAVRIPGTNWIAAVAQPTSEAFAFLNFSRNIFYATFGGSLVLLTFISLLLSENLTQPIRKLQESTELLKQGKLETRVNIRSGDEVEEFANSFNVMTTRLLEREHSLESEKQQMEVLMQSLSDGVLAIDESNQILIFNQSAEQITGLKSDGVLNKNIDEVLHFYHDLTQVTLHQYYAIQTSAGENERQKPLHIFAADGRKITLALNIKPVEFEEHGHQGWMVTFRDITKEHEFEEMKLDFVAMAAHELRTPLTAIRGYLSILNEEAQTTLDVQSRTFLQRAVISSQQLSSLVENLLNVSRIERGRLKLDLVPSSIEKVVEMNMEHLLQLAQQKNINLVFNHPEKMTPLVMIDHFRIGEVITNLVSNSIQYTQENGTVEIYLEDVRNELIIHIKDNGQGIPKEAIPHLFTKFYRVSGRLSQGSKGTGLGLFISKAIIEAHQGRIWVESEVNKGSTFSFSLPKA